MSAKRLNYRTYSTLITLLVTVAVLTAIAGFPGKARAFSVTITVFTSADNTTLDNQCSLREAIINANDNADTNKDCSTGLGHEIINFDGALTTAPITLGSALPAINDTAGLTIIGGGKITISGNDLYRVFSTGVDVPLTLDGLTVAHGRGAPDGGGAYLSIGSTLTVLNSTFSNNSAPDNIAFGAGGGIYNNGTLIITNSIFSDNSAYATGGAVINVGTQLTITNSTFSGNSAGYGGGVRNESSMTVINSTFSANSAPSFGGGVYNHAGTLTVTGSTFSSNTAGAGGAINNFTNLTLANSTFFGNSAGIGGGVYNGATATITNNTFSGNSATTSGAGVSNSGQTMILANNIIANSTQGGDCDDPGFSNPGSTHNLIEDGVNACDLTDGSSGNIVGHDPDLGPGDGSPVYITLNGSSLAIDAGDDAACATPAVNNTSQNGVSRPQGAHCDIGAYEADVTPPTVVSILRADPNPTSSASLHFTVTFSEAVYGVAVNDFSLTTSGVSGAAVSGVNSSSGSTYTVTVSTGSGLGTIRLDLMDHDTILDAANLHLGGDGPGNGNFNSGEVYAVRFLHTYLARIQR